MNIPVRPPRIAVVGSAAWDVLIVVDRFPDTGDYKIVREVVSMPGGTTSNSAVTLARLNADVSIVATVGDDKEGEMLRLKLVEEGVKVEWLNTRLQSATDFMYIVVSTEPPTRTIFWRVGTRIGNGDVLDLESIYRHDVVILDVNDFELRRIMGSSEERLTSDAIVVGTITNLVGDYAPPQVGMQLALNDDILVGNEQQFLQLTSMVCERDAVDVLHQAMETSRLDAFVVTRGGHGCTLFTRRDRFDFPAWPIEVVDTTGAGDAFAGASAFGVACKWEWTEICPFANAVGTLATRGLGAQATLPTIEEVVALMKWYC